MMKQHKCGKCEKSFKTEKEYLDHVCVSGFKPTQPENLGEQFIKISEAALKRGEARK